MSNELLNEGFFNNPNIPDCEKLGVVALIGGGALDKGAISEVGKDVSFSSVVPCRGGLMPITPVIFTYGRPESLNRTAVQGCLKVIGIESDAGDYIFNSSKNDKDLLYDIVKFFRVTLGIDKLKQDDAYDRVVKDKLEYYIEKLRVTDPYLTENPKILTDLKTNVETAFGVELKNSNDYEKKTVKTA